MHAELVQHLAILDKAGTICDNKKGNIQNKKETIRSDTIYETGPKIRYNKCIVYLNGQNKQKYQSQLSEEELDHTYCIKTTI